MADNAQNESRPNPGQDAQSGRSSEKDAKAKMSKRASTLNSDNPGFWQKYKFILISITLFLVFDVGVLVVNFYNSFQISQNAIGVNLSGRQRMLSQRTVKAILQINAATGDSGKNDAATKSVEELKTVEFLFGDTLHGFDKGKIVTNADGTPVFLKKVEDQGSLAAVASGLQLWTPYKQKIDDFLKAYESGGEFAEPLADLTQYALANNLTLLKYMNDLTVALEEVANGQAKFLRVVQVSGLTLALINFFVLMGHFMSQLRQSEAKVARARKEVEDIMSTVNEGLFLIDRDLQIGTQISKRLESMLGQPNLAGRNLRDVLAALVPEKDLDNARTFVDELYSEWVLEELIEDLNPLKRIKIVAKNHRGEEEARWLAFRFQRVTEGKLVARVLVNVRDITQEVELEERIKADQERNDAQVGMLAAVINADPVMLGGFVKSTLSRIEAINQSLKDPASDENSLRRKVDLIARNIHSVKGEASALNLTGYVDICENMEDKIGELRKQDRLKGNDFIALAMQLDSLLTLAQTTETLAARFDPSSVSEQASQRVGAKLAQSRKTAHKDFYTKFAKEIAQRNGKEVDVVCEGVDEVKLSDSASQSVQDIVVQLLRNAIVHGLEKPELRQERSKSAQGHVGIRLQTDGQGLASLTVEDDGAGLDYDKIRDKLQREGKLPPGVDAASIDKKALINAIFKPGFSTLEQSGADAGRGVGMDIIREQARNLKGSIFVKTIPGRLTRFTVRFKIPQAQNPQPGAAAS